MARLYFGANELGVYWPDEIHQSLEPAHRAAFGYGLVAWEFRDGARSWAFPGLLAAFLRLVALFGLDQPGEYLAALRVLFISISVATGWACYRLARVVGASELASIAAATGYGLVALTLYFAHRGMSETTSAFPVVLGFAWALERSPGGESVRWKRLGGAALLAFAVLLRLQNGVFCLGLLGIFAAERRWRELAEVAGVLAAGALAYGLLDWVTWGRPFHSAIVYLQFNVIEGKASLFGRSPFGYYLRLISSFTLAPLMVVLALLGLGMKETRARGVIAVAIAFVLLLSRVPHKELRFIATAVPLLYVGVALGLDVLSRAAPRAVLCAGLLLASLYSTARTPGLKFGDLGQYEDLKPQQSAWGDFAGVNRLLIAAHRLPDLCGMKIEAAHLAWTGGHSHLHREVPLYHAEGPGRGSGYYNYVLTPAPYAEGLQIAQRDGGLVLARLPNATCVEDPGYAWEVP